MSSSPLLKVSLLIHIFPAESDPLILVIRCLYEEKNIYMKNITLFFPMGDMLLGKATLTYEKPPSIKYLLSYDLLLNMLSEQNR